MVPRNSKLVTVNDTSHADVIHPHIGRQRSLVFGDRFLHLPVNFSHRGSFVGRDSNVINKDDTSRSEKLKTTKCSKILKAISPYSEAGNPYRFPYTVDKHVNAENLHSVLHCSILYPVADSGGAPGAPPPPTAQNFLDFMQFFGKFDKFVCWRPPPRGLAPLLQGILDPPLIPTKHWRNKILLVSNLDD